MTALTDVPTWEALADLYGKVSYDDEAARLVIGEARRREGLERAKRARQAGVSAWTDAAHAQYMAAEAACNGNLVRRDSPVRDAWSLWIGTGAYALAHASEELRLWWQEPGNARITVSQWREQTAAGKRQQISERDAAQDETGQHHREGTMGALGAAGHIAGHVARDAGRVAYEGARVASYHQRAHVIGQQKAAELHAATVHAQVAVREPGTVMVGRTLVDAPALLRRTLEGMGLLFTDYVAFPSRASVIAVVTWTAQAAARDADGKSIWRAFVRLLLTSRLNGSGKSTVADIIRMLLLCRTGRMSKVTPYGLCKVLGTWKEVAIADDAQNTFRSDKAGAELLTVMINGYTPGATWVSGKSDGKVEDASGPLVIVGKDDLMTKRAEYLKDLIDRSAVVRMERPDHYMPEFDEEAEARAASLGATLKAVTGALQAQLKQAARELAQENRGRLITDGDGGRTAQIWRPMLAVARVADGDGGPWYEATLQAMEELSAAGGDLLKAEEALTELEELHDDGRSFWDAVPGPARPVADEDYDEISEEE